jgi:hypothetical protein
MNNDETSKNLESLFDQINKICIYMELAEPKLDFNFQEYKQKPAFDAIS